MEVKIVTKFEILFSESNDTQDDTNKYIFTKYEMSLVVFAQKLEQNIKSKAIENDTS